MKGFHRLVLLGLFLMISSLFSYDMEYGKVLYFEAKCQKCHTSKDFTAKNSKIHDFVKLQWRVKRCDFTMKAGWFDEEIEDIVHYLNDYFYKFDTN